MESSSGGGSSVGEVVTPEVQSKITSKLQEIFGDDDVSVLTDYICHMVNHNQPKEHIINELKEFLSDEASQFGTWVFQLVESSKNDYSTNNNMPNINHDNGLSKNNSSPNDTHKSSTQSNQNKDSLDFAISNAIKNKSGSGRSKPFQPASSHKNNHSLINHESSSGPMVGNNRLPRVNYRNAPYTRSNNFNQSGAPYNSSNQAANSSTGPSSTHGKIKIRCKNWPNCDKGDHCFYIHPSEACKSWPLCPYGPGCFFIHPTVPCRYGLACYNSLCNYSHPNGWDPNHVEAPVFKYGGYKNSSLIINNNKQSQTIGNANSNSAESNNDNSTNTISINLNQENTDMPSYDSNCNANTGHFNLESEKNNSFGHN